MLTKRILIVDDTREQLDFLEDTARRYLSGWDIVDVATKDEAITALEEHRDFAVVVVDRYLTAEHDDPQLSMDVLRKVDECCPNAFRILVSRWLDQQPELGADAPRIDCFVSLAPRDTRPSMVLGAALSDGAAHYYEEPVPR